MKCGDLNNMNKEIIDCPMAKYCKGSPIFGNCVQCECDVPLFKITVGCKDCQNCIDVKKKYLTEE